MKVYQVLQFVDGFGNDIYYFNNGLFLKEEDAIAFIHNEIKEQYSYELKSYEDECKEEEEAALNNICISRMVPIKKPNLEKMLEERCLGKVDLNEQEYRHMCMFYIEVELREKL